MKTYTCAFCKSAKVRVLFNNQRPRGLYCSACDSEFFPVKP